MDPGDPRERARRSPRRTGRHLERAVVALVGNPATGVVSNTGGLYNWQRIVSARQLEATPLARACGIEALTGVALLPAGQLVVGASCSRPGKVGVFEDTGERLATEAPPLPSSSATSRTSVLRLRSFDGGVIRFDRCGFGARTALFGTRLAGHARWSTPVGFHLGPTGQLISSGVSSDGGLVVLVSSTKALASRS